VNDVVLWHFPVSHFNEKVRWALDWKRIPHRRRALGPDYLWRAWWATGRAQLPVLFLDGRAIGDSTAIIGALERLHPVPALYPADPQARRRALELEDWLDEHLGPPVRAAIVGTGFAEDPAAVIAALSLGMPPRAARFMRAFFPAFRAFYRARHGMRAGDVGEHTARVFAALDRLEDERAGRPYLVGDAFSVADLTAAALFAPLVLPPEMQYPPDLSSPALRPLRERALAHPMARWTAETYRRHRGASAER